MTQSRPQSPGADTANRTIAPALARLVFLQARGKWRRTIRRLRSPRRLLLSCLALGLLGIWIGQTMVAIVLRVPADPDRFRSALSLGMLAMCAIKLARIFIDRDESGAALRRAEVNLLEAGPFHRWQVRAYKVAGHTLSVFSTALLASLFLLPDVTYWLAGFTGAFLCMLFMYLLYMTVAVCAIHVSQYTYDRVRTAVCIVTTAWLSVCFVRGIAARHTSLFEMLRGILTAVGAIRDTWIGRVMIAPFDVFSQAVCAEQLFPDLAVWAAAGTAMVAVLLVLLLWLETYVTRRTVADEKRRFVESRLSNTGKGEPARGLVRVRGWLPGCPRFAGAGPLGWRQLIAVVHNAGGVALLLAGFAGSAAVVSLATIDSAQGGGLAVCFTLFVFTYFLVPAALPFDFRADVDRMGLLKSLPLAPLAVVLGQLLVPVATTTVCQLTVVAILGIADSRLWPELLVGLGLLIPGNILIFGLENLIFLLYPYRRAELDVQAHVRRVLTLAGKLLVLGIAYLFALGVAHTLILAVQVASRLGIAPVHHARGLLLTAICGSLFLSACGIVGLVCHAYSRFDPRMDVPD